MKKTILAALALSLLCLGPVLAQQTAPADDTAAKRQDIRKLLELTGSSKIGQQIAAQMIPMFRQANPKVPQEFWDGVVKEFDANSMIELIIPIYEKHLTHDDIKGLITFYQSPLGHKMAAATPQIAQESMQAGQQWGMQIAQKVQKQLEEQKKSPK